jgi:hypothetical protein
MLCTDAYYNRLMYRFPHKTVDHNIGQHETPTTLAHLKPYTNSTTSIITERRFIEFICIYFYEIFVYHNWST